MNDLFYRNQLFKFPSLFGKYDPTAYLPVTFPYKQLFIYDVNVDRGFPSHILTLYTELFITMNY